MQIIQRLLNEETNEYEFSDTEAGRKALSELMGLMSQQGLIYEMSPDNSMALRVSGFGNIAFVNSYIDEMAKK
jgi:hypothetical protein